ncbi:DUF1214 domain-containing protein [Halioxenophilus sp. WMMB6]|uniref:DUF1214 domain-containing protein n=1 Tax=Halioxenophilus sp. WMMB6 TaxID=3073815 RepID=UPI00295E624C|nr:DUF1214 domain-containing protein [Halioxenophilus sp. WMMB6]
MAETNTLSPTQVAWDAYAEVLRNQREALISHNISSDPMIREQGLYALHSQEATAFNMYMYPRQQYPLFFQQAMPFPVGLSWGMPCPDFLSHQTFINGANTYRVYGNMTANFWSTLQLFKSFWGEGQVEMLANVDFDKIPVKDNGDFEIYLGPNPPPDAKDQYWVKLDPDANNIMLALRETFYDWENDQQMDLHIENLDRSSDAPLYFSETELAERIGKARKFVEYNFQFMMASVNKLIGQAESIHGLPYLNMFFHNDQAARDGGNPLATFVGMTYDLAPDEAIIIDMAPAEARYWSIQLGSVWAQTSDFSYHQSSINGAQAHMDEDGHFRAVLSLTDPEVPNWLDPASIPTGVAMLRFYKYKEVVIPATKKVPLAEVRQHLPESTPTVTPGQRATQLRRRRDASLKRYGL